MGASPILPQGRWRNSSARIENGLSVFILLIQHNNECRGIVLLRSFRQNTKTLPAVTSVVYVLNSQNGCRREIIHRLQFEKNLLRGLKSLSVARRVAECIGGDPTTYFPNFTPFFIKQVSLSSVTSIPGGKRRFESFFAIRRMVKYKTAASKPALPAYYLVL